MSKTLSKTIVFAIAVVLAAAPFVLAQTSGSGSATSGQMSPGATSTPPSRVETGTSSSSTGARDTLNATVQDVNHQRNTLKLKMQDGETVEFKVPQASLTNLNKGDMVQVSIHKAEAGSSSMGTPPAQPARPQSSAPSTSSPGTRSQ